MLRRSFLELSWRRSSMRRIPREITLQRRPSFLYSRKGFSTGPGAEPPQPKSNLPKVFLGSAVIAGTALLAYRSGYLDKYIGKEQPGSYNRDNVGIDHKDAKENGNLGEQIAVPISGEEPKKFCRDADQATQVVGGQTDLPHADIEEKVETPKELPHVGTEEKVGTHMDVHSVEDEQKVEAQRDVPNHGTVSEAQGEFHSRVQDTSDVTLEKGTVSVVEKLEVDASQSEISEGSQELKTTKEPHEGEQVAEVQTQARVIPEENEQKTVPSQHTNAEDKSEDALGKGIEVANLLDAYHLKEKEKADESTAIDGEQVLISGVGELNDGDTTEDRKLVLDFLQAIHEAEKRQAELDARKFTEEIRALKEKYEKKLRDLRARELMHAEEAAMLDKELKRERAKAAAAIRALQEKMEEKLRMELEQKENETEMKLQKVQELAKAELIAAIAKEKTAQIEKMAEANVHIKALCLAFYARSEEARQIHFVHKLALGALALEDAVSKGLAIQNELDALNTYLEDVDEDSLLHLVLSTLPEETRLYGTDTLLQLNQKFNSLKGTLRHHILIPPGGRGILTHALAHVASLLRIKEVDPSGEGIESIISRVESFLAEGKLAEAADALQEGVQGSQAEEMTGDWVRRARNRAITEQALTVLQSYATSISLTQ